MSRRESARRAIKQAAHDELVRVVNALLDEEPALIATVEAILNLAPEGDAGMADVFDLKTAREEARAIVGEFGDLWGYSSHRARDRFRRPLEERLDALRQRGERLAEAGRSWAAASVLGGLALELGRHQEWQEECELSWRLETALEALTLLMEKESDGALRETLLRDVFGALLVYDLCSGGYAVDEMVWPTLEAHLDEQGRRALAEEIRRAYLEALARRDDEGAYLRREVGQALARLVGEDEARMPGLVAVADEDKTRAEELIEKGGREAYRKAAQLIARLRRGYEEADRQAAFEDYLVGLRERHGRRRSLWQELQTLGIA